ncbi:MAG: hypothetical protein OXH78_09855 [Acidimicrobiaceae bacterium]|nr:hypothetical protein [Acidimicrobiaceae bacterium]
MAPSKSRNVWRIALRLGAFSAVALLLATCADDDDDAPTGLTGAEVEMIVESIVESAMADMPAPDAGLSRADVAEIVEGAIASMPDPEPALTAMQVESIARSVAISSPSRSNPSDYTQFFVDSAIARYEAEGLDATLEYYNTPGSVDGPWYVFIVDPDDRIAADFNDARIGGDLNDPEMFSDIHGYHYGAEILTATEDGKWVGYAYQNPETGDISAGDYGDYELKSSWIVSHDGYLFGSGWYINADEMTQDYVHAAADAYKAGGLQGMVETLSANVNVHSGGAALVEHYNSYHHIEGDFLSFTAAPNGTILAHTDASKIGTHIDEVFAGADYEFTESGNWVETVGTVAETEQEITTRLFAIDLEGTIIASGWRHEGHEGGH